MQAAGSVPPPPRGRGGLAWRSVLALLIGALVWVTYASTFRGGELAQLWLMVIDPLIGGAALVLALAGVRRFPLAVGLLTAATSCVSAVAAGPATYALGSTATGRRWLRTGAVALANIVAGYVLDRVYPHVEEGTPWWVTLVVGLLAVAVVVAVGVVIGQRRELLAGLKERAETAERERATHEETVRIAERNRIAREMHDVLAHRISLVAMHAGALGFRADLSRQEQATAARTIEENAHLALQELRDVLGVLRDPTTGDAGPERPQPLLADVSDLVADARGAGMRVVLDEHVDGVPPTTVSRTAYRVVQEGLTNARKHAPHTAVTVAVAGTMADGLTVRVINPVSRRPEAGALPGAGVGLLGLAERVDRLGGRISHGPDRDGDHELAVWLPWTG